MSISSLLATGTPSSYLNLNVNSINANTITGNVIPNNSSSEFIVSPPSENAKYTTIQSAINACVLAGGVQTIIIKPGTYPEDIILAPNINIVGSQCNFNNVISPVVISGSVTAEYVGNSSISNVKISNPNGDCIKSLSNVTCTLNISNCTLETTFVTGNCINSNNTGLIMTVQNSNFLETGLNYINIQAGDTIIIRNSWMGVLPNKPIKPVIVNSGILAFVSNIITALIQVGVAGGFISLYNFYTDIGDNFLANISGFMLAMHDSAFSDTTSSPFLYNGTATGTLAYGLIVSLGRTGADVGAGLSLLPLSVF